MKTSLLILFLFTIPILSLAQTSPDVKISLLHQQDKNGKTEFFLHCSTLNEFNNTSTTIVYKKKRRGNAYTITFKKTYTPDKVTKGIGPATAHISLGHLSDGEYNFSFVSLLSGGEIRWNSVLTIKGETVTWE